MKNKKIIILIILALIAAVSVGVVFVSKGKKKEEVTTGGEVKEEEIATESAGDLEEIEELEFSEEELERYYAVYDNPFVIHIRKALNGYLDGTNEGIEFPDAVVEAHMLEDAPAGLDSFSKEYYKSKFIVLAINDSVVGGKEIAIIFQDKPDKIFNAWIYKMADGTYDFRGIWQNMNFVDEELNELVKFYKKYIEDREHAL